MEKYKAIPLWFIRRPLQRYTNFLVSRAVLLVCGFFRIDVTRTDPSHINRESFIESIQNSISGLNSGDLIIANHISYIELFYLAFRYSPVFATIVYDKDKPKLVRQGVFNAFLHVAFGIQLGEPKGEKLSDILLYAKQYHMGPVVLFPEGVTTNGRAILRFQPVFDEKLNRVLKENNLKMHIIGFSPCFHVGSFFSHFIKLLSQIYSNLHVHYIKLHETQAQEFDASVFRKYLSECSKARPVASTMKDKFTFIDYWNKTQSKDYALKE